MKRVVLNSKIELGKKAADAGALTLRNALAATGEATLVLATGASQFEVLAALVQEPGIEWERVTCFHLDEYVGISETHPASFRGYLRERFTDQLPGRLAAFHYINPGDDPEAECARLSALISGRTIDVMFCGIGENGHLAFNDPPADFETDRPYLVVNLDDACRRQQLGEGWFPTFEAVPSRAISMSIRQMMKAKQILCTVPDARKAQAVKDTLEGSVTPLVPASILQKHPDTVIYLDPPATGLLNSSHAG